MIPSEILLRLVPESDPEDGEFPRDERVLKADPDGPGRRVGVWAAYLRWRLSRQLVDDPRLRELVETSAAIGTGVFRALDLRHEREGPDFRTVAGYQFGAVLFRGAFSPEAEDAYVGEIPMDFGRRRAPVFQTIASFNPHALQTGDGYVAAVFEDDDGKCCGITAGHVVNHYGRGQRVPVLCPDCGDEARLRRRAPGLIDAALVEFPCGGPIASHSDHAPAVRSAVEAETVEAHFGTTGQKLCTVMMSLSTPSQIKTAAAPKHFLTDIHGHDSDSGSLISERESMNRDRDLIGMYLGEADCEDENRSMVTYGYAIDLKQVADLFGAKDPVGEFNV